MSCVIPPMPFEFASAAPWVNCKARITRMGTLQDSRPRRIRILPRLHGVPLRRGTGVVVRHEQAH
jgi:hypothetical protein